MSPSKEEQRLLAFSAAAQDRLSRLVVAFIRLEQKWSDAEIRREILLELHSLKGEAGLLGLSKIATLGHLLEEATIALGTNKVASREAVLDLVLSGLDLVSDQIKNEDGQDSPALLEFERELRSSITIADAGQDPASGGAEKVGLKPGPADPSRDDNRVGAARETTIQVQTEKLDRLRDLVGDLLVARTRLSSIAREIVGNKGTRGENEVLDSLSSSMVDDVQRIGNLVGGLEELARELRMVPIGKLFADYPRFIRDLARDVGRQVQLVVAGENTHVDRDVLEALEDPLLHLVRNAVDHGIEGPDEREANGKARQGTLRLEARLRGSSVELVVTDDGRGIDIEKIRAKAVALGAMEESRAVHATREDLLRLLFTTGFTTKREITDISGRGVGLDVVQDRLTALGGSLQVDSELGRGTTFTVRAPISVALSTVMLFKVGDGHYALPAASVVSVLDADLLQVFEGPRGPTTRFGPDLVPVLSLARILEESSETNGTDERIMLVDAVDRRLALTGTDSHELREAVFAPLGSLIQRRGLMRAGVTLEDGSVALVLAPGALAHRQERSPSQRRPITENDDSATSAPCVVVADDSPIIRDLIADVLSQKGLTIIEAGDGREALDRLQRASRVDMLITDIEMPRMDGIELIREVRSIRRFAKTPIMVVSTRTSADDQERALAAGADSYLVKSNFSRRGLWQAVVEALQRG